MWEIVLPTPFRIHAPVTGPPNTACLRALHVHSVSSADAEAEHALNGKAYNKLVYSSMLVI